MNNEDLEKSFEAMMFTLSTFQKGFNTLYQENRKKDMNYDEIIKLTNVWWQGVSNMIARMAKGDSNENS